jgi:hypothetical protein
MAKKDKLKIKEVVKAVKESKGMLSAAADKLGVNYTTLWRYSKRYPAVQEAIDDQRDSVSDMAELKLFQSIRRGESWAVGFYLKPQGKGRGYVERTESNVDVTSKGKAINNEQRGNIPESTIVDTIAILKRAGVLEIPGDQDTENKPE